MMHFALLNAILSGICASEQSPLSIEVPPELPKNRPLWIGDYLKALDQAQARNCPVFVVLSDDQSVGFQTMWNAVYATPEFAKLCNQCVLLIAFKGTETPKETRTIDGKEIEWCKLFDVSCLDRIRSYELIHARFVTREFWNPLHLYLDPLGMELARLEGHEITLERIHEELQCAVEMLKGPSLSYQKYREILVRMKLILDGRERRGPASAMEELRQFAEKELFTAPLQELAQRLLRRMEQEGEDLLQAAEILVGNGKTSEAKTILVRIIKGFRGLPVAAKAQERLAQIK